MMLGASIAVIALAIVRDLVFEITQRLLRRTPGTA